MPRACPVEHHVRRYIDLPQAKLDATALSRGGSRSQLNSRDRENSTGQARGILRLGFRLCIAVSVNLHGPSSWHPLEPFASFWVNLSRFLTLGWPIPILRHLRYGRLGAKC